MVSSSNLNTLGGGQMSKVSLASKLFKTSELSYFLDRSFWEDGDFPMSYSIGIRPDAYSTGWERLELNSNEFTDIFPYLKTEVFNKGFWKTCPTLIKPRTGNVKPLSLVFLENINSGDTAYCVINHETLSRLQQFLAIRVSDDEEDWQEC